MTTEKIVLVAFEHSAFCKIHICLEDRILSNFDRTPINEIKCLLLEDFYSACLREGEDGIGRQ